MSAALGSVEALLRETLEQGWQHLLRHDLAGAMEYARQASVMAPDSPDVAHLLGLLASRDGRPDLALPLLRKALAGGVTARRLRDMAEALLAAGHAQAALAPLQDAIRQFGESAETLGLLAAVQAALQDYAAAELSASRAVAWKPHLMAWEGNLAFCRLIRQQFLEGFRSHTGRTENLAPGSRCPALQFAEPGDLWLKNEQGPGDTLFHLRHAPALAGRGWRLHIQTDRKTRPLLRATGLFASVKEELRIPRGGFWLNMGDLPLAGLQLGLDAAPPPLPLAAERERVAKMREKLAAIGPAPYLAVTWRAGPRGRKLRDGLRMYDKHVDPHELGRVLAGVPATVLSVQRVPEADEAAAFRAGLGRDFADLSALNDRLEDMLALLGLVEAYVAVPNTNVHLRAGLGGDAYVLVNHPVQDWRWLAEGENSPWYPRMRIFRERSGGGWTPALEALRQAVRARFPAAAGTGDSHHDRAVTPPEPSSPRAENERGAPRSSAKHGLGEQQRAILKAGWEAVGKPDLPAAIRAAHRVLQAVPEHPEALHLLGWSAMRDLKLELAANVLGRAYELAPHEGRIAGDYLRCLAANERNDEAIELATRALADAELRNRSSVLYGRAAVYLKQNRLAEAIADYGECLRANPNRLDAMEYRGLARLKLGDARAGFRDNTARKVALRPELFNDWCCPRLRPEHRGSRVLIKRDMGLGDELTYLRYLPWLTGAGMVADYWAGRKLAPVLQRMGHLHRVWPDDAPPPDAREYDLSFIVNELPVAVELLGAPDIAPPLPLTPRADLREKWRVWLASCGPGPYVGLTWRAGAAAEGAANLFSKLAKAVDADLFADAIKPVHATFISLQRNVLADELHTFRQRLGAPLHDAAARTDDLEDLLALLSLLDENVGVSNTNMHLRAGLGSGSRVLAQNPGGDWRWGHEGSTSLWFTESKVYRQTPDGGWDAALRALQADLLEQYGERRPPTPPPQAIVPPPPQAGEGQGEKEKRGEGAKQEQQPAQSRRLIWLTAGAIKNEGGGRTSSLASARYRVLAPADALQSLGWKSEIVNEEFSQVMGGWGSSVPQPGDTVVISKVFTEHALKLAHDARARGARVVADFCDNLLDHPQRGPLQKALLQVADRVVASTEAMAHAIKKHGCRVDAIISDPMELPRGEIRFAPGDTLDLLWFGHAVNIDTLAPFLPQLARYAEQQPLRLNVVTLLPNGRAGLDKIVPAGLAVTYTPWSVEATRQAIENCDLVVIPVLASQFKAAKSPNRLLEPLWAGRFVVAGPLPAYRPFGDSAWVGDDLVAGIRWALANPEAVRARIAQGQGDVATLFTRDAVAQAWHKLLGSASHAAGTVACERQPAAPLRLNLGCGDKILPGYVNVDVVESRAGKKPDVLCDLHKLEPFADNSVDEILAVHVVEHFWRWEVPDILKEWVRVLKPGGRMILECPNLLSACEEFLKNPEAAATGGPQGQRSMWVFYGDPRWQDPYMVHRWGYTPRSLAQLMQETGLVNARQEPAQFKLREPRDMRVVAEKPAVPGQGVEPGAGSDPGMPQPWPGVQLAGPRSPRVAVYTAIIGDYDEPPVIAEPDPALDYILFTDGQREAWPSPWQVRRLPRVFDDPQMDARRVKVLSHLFLPDFDAVVWIDANVTPRTLGLGRIREMLASSPIALCGHLDRNCIYDEAAQVVQAGRDAIAPVLGQIRYYQTLDFPRGFGLHATMFLARRHREPAVARFNSRWWEILARHSKRDQLSFDFVRWEQGVQVRTLPLNYRDNELFAWGAGRSGGHKGKARRNDEAMGRALAAAAGSVPHHGYDPRHEFWHNAFLRNLQRHNAVLQACGILPEPGNPLYPAGEERFRFALPDPRLGAARARWLAVLGESRRVVEAGFVTGHAALLTLHHTAARYTALGTTSAAVLRSIAEAPGAGNNRFSICSLKEWVAANVLRNGDTLVLNGALPDDEAVRCLQCLLERAEVGARLLVGSAPERQVRAWVEAGDLQALPLLSGDGVTVWEMRWCGLQRSQPVLAEHAVDAAGGEDGYTRSVYGVWLKNRPQDATWRFCVNGKYGRFYSDWLRAQRGCVFLDIGANVGLYSLVASQNPGIERIYAFEPHPDTYGFLIANIEKNSAVRCSAFPYAISTYAGEQVIAVRPGHSGMATLREVGRRDGFSQSVGIKSITATELNRLVEIPDGAWMAVKIDVEGHEAVVIEQLRESGLWNRITNIYYEVDENYLDSAALAQLLEREGFRVVHQNGHGRHYDVMVER